MWRPMARGWSTLNSVTLVTPRASRARETLTFGMALEFGIAGLLPPGVCTRCATAVRRPARALAAISPRSAGGLCGEGEKFSHLWDVALTTSCEGVRRKGRKIRAWRGNSAGPECWHAECYKRQSRIANHTTAAS